MMTVTPMRSATGGPSGEVELSAAGRRLSSGGSALNSNVLLPTGTGPTCRRAQRRIEGACQPV